MTTIKGRNVKIKYIDDDVLKTLAACKTCSINIDLNMIEVASPTQGDVTSYIPGKMSFSIECGKFYTQEESKLWDLFFNKTKFLVLWSESDDGQKGFMGNAYIQRMQGTGNVGSLATLNISIIGTDFLQRVDNIS